MKIVNVEIYEPERPKMQTLVNNKFFISSITQFAVDDINWKPFQVKSRNDKGLLVGNHPTLLLKFKKENIDLFLYQSVYVTFKGKNASMLKVSVDENGANLKYHDRQEIGVDMNKAKEAIMDFIYNNAISA